MTDENKNVEPQETEKGCCCNCGCPTELFKKFLVVALGSFVGVFLAMSLFVTLNRPPMPMPGHHPGMMPPPPPHHHMKPAPPHHFGEGPVGVEIHKEPPHRPDVHREMERPRP